MAIHHSNIAANPGSVQPLVYELTGWGVRDSPSYSSADRDTLSLALIRKAHIWGDRTKLM